MYKKYIFQILILLLISAMEISFISGLPLYLSNLNLPLIALVFILVLGDLPAAVLYSLGFGLILDIYSFSFFGMHIVSFTTTVLAANFLLIKFFTDRSLYTFLALTGSATIIYELIANSLDYIFCLLSNKARITIWGNFFLKAELYQLFYNLAAAFLIFYAVHYISKSFKPVFLIKNNLR